MHRRGVHHLLRRGPGGRGRAPSHDDGRAEVLVERPARDGRRQPGRRPAARRPRAGPRRRGRSTTPRWSGAAVMSERADRLPLPLHRGGGARRVGASSPTWPRRPGPRSRESRALRAATLERCADTAGRRRRGHGRALQRRRAALRLRQRRQRHRRRGDGRAVPPPAAAGAPCRPCPWWTTGPCSPPWPTTSASTLVFSRQIIAHARPGDIAVGFSTSGDSVNVLRAFEEASRRGLLTVGLCGYEGGAMAASDAVATAWWCAPTASTGSRRPRTRSMLRAVVDPCSAGLGRDGAGHDRRRRSDDRLPPAGRRRSSSASRPSAGAGPACSTRSSPWPTAPAARRRPPCSTPCSCPPSPTTPTAAQTDAAVLDLALGRAPGLQHRLLRRQAAALPRRLGRPPGRARHGQRPGHDGRPPARPVGRLRARGGLPDRRRSARSWPTWPRRPPPPASPIVTGDTKVVDHGAADGMYISTAGVGLIPAGRDAVGRPRCADGDVVLVVGHHRRPRHGGHAGPRATWRSRPTSSRTPPRCTSWWRTCWPPPRPPAGCATPPGAAWAPSATSWPATAT